MFTFLHKHIRFVFCFLFLSVFLKSNLVNAEIPITSETKISLITCGAGYEVYSMYGHTALRVKNPKLGYDYIFNYGVFSLQMDNFAYLFVKGETDYQVVITTFDSFIQEYVDDNRDVYENEFQLTDSSKRLIVDYLEWNLQPENKVYRYKFFSDNCATRIRTILEKSANIQWNTNSENRIKPPQSGQFSVVINDYWKTKTQYTFRDIILIYQSKLPWINAAIQIPIAAPADTHLTYRAAMFLPDFLMDAVQNATVVNNGIVMPLSKPAEQLLIPNQKLLPANSSFLSSPFVVLTCVFILLFLVTLLGIYRRRMYRFIDCLLLFITGIIGVLLIFMSFVSVHESMRPNFNLWWAFPVNFIAFFFVLFSYKILMKYYTFLFVIYGLFFFSLPFIPQSIPFIQCLFPVLIFFRFIAYKSLENVNDNKY